MDITKGENLEEVQWQVDTFDDIKILQYRVGGFEELTLKQKTLIYYLSEAALCGRDILFDQHFKYNLAIRGELEKIYTTFDGDRTTTPWIGFETYLKKVWFSSGIHHHYSNDKFTPTCSREYYISLLEACGMEVDTTLVDIIFDPQLYPKRVSQDTSSDLITSSAVNFYEGVTQHEVEEFYKEMSDPKDQQPPSYGLNSKVEKNAAGEIVERHYKMGGMYSAAIEKIVYWLEKAEQFAENDSQKKTIGLLIEYYKTADLKTFDQYSINWVEDTQSKIDFVNGFIENYTDPLGQKATWEAIVNFKNEEATLRTQAISAEAQWFEDHSPVAPQFKKKVVKGVSAKVITAAIIAGDCYPASPIGINLPNADWIRRDHGSKSVTIANFTQAYNKASVGSGFGTEFYPPQVEGIIKEYSAISHDVAVDLHECLGHGSGQLLEGVKGDELKNYSSPLEEARAELFALYYIADQKLIDLGVIPSSEAAIAEYYTFIFNGMMGQLTRVKEGATIEQAHMRCRQLIAWWAYELGSKDQVIELQKKEGKSYVVINNYAQLRSIFGEMLAEIQRIKSEGDYARGKELIETYGVKVNQELHKEVLERYAKLNIAPYSGFVNPQYKAIKDQNGEITDVEISYPANYTQQHLLYSKEYSFL
ncbi:MAG: dihydrofolate reductase [Rikenellaceae bacterium]